MGPLVNSKVNRNNKVNANMERSLGDWNTGASAGCNHIKYLIGLKLGNNPDMPSVCRLNRIQWQTGDGSNQNRMRQKANGTHSKIFAMTFFVRYPWPDHCLTLFNRHFYCLWIGLLFGWGVSLLLIYFGVCFLFSSSCHR